jgi:hypothetical protein
MAIYTKACGGRQQRDKDEWILTEVAHRRQEVEREVRSLIIYGLVIFCSFACIITTTTTTTTTTTITTTEIGENCIMRSFIGCTLLQV